MEDPDLGSTKLEMRDCRIIVTQHLLLIKIIPVLPTIQLFVRFDFQGQILQNLLWTPWIYHAESFKLDFAFTGQLVGLDLDLYPLLVSAGIFNYSLDRYHFDFLLQPIGVQSIEQMSNSWITYVRTRPMKLTFTVPKKNSRQTTIIIEIINNIATRSLKPMWEAPKPIKINQVL
jgi:hypothetical protein